MAELGMSMTTLFDVRLRLLDAERNSVRATLSFATAFGYCCGVRNFDNSWIVVFFFV